MTTSAAAVQAGLVAALRTALGDQVTGVFDGPPMRAALPYAAIAETVTTDWSAKGMAGREHRIAVAIWDEGGRPARLHRLMAASEEAIEGMARDLDGWRIASRLFVRARLVRSEVGPWAGLVEYRVRTVAVQASG